MPGYNVQNQPGIGDASQAFADMLAATLRGATKATLGFPGDIEGLGRMGINALGGNVSPEPAMRTTEEWSKALPPLGTKNPYEDIGQFAPVNAVGPAVKGLKGAASIANALRTVSPAAEVGTAADMGRRGALQLLGKGAGVAAAGTVAPMAVVKALKAASPEAGLVPMAARTAVKAGAGALSRNAALLASAKSVERLGHGGYFPEDVLKHLEKAYPKATDAELAKMLPRLDDIERQGGRWLRFADDPAAEFERGYLGKGTLTREALAKQGLKTQEDIYDAILHGKLKADDVHPNALWEDWHPGGKDSLMRAIDAAEGWAEPYEMLWDMKPAEIRKYTNEVNAARKQAGLKPMYNDVDLADLLKETP